MHAGTPKHTPAPPPARPRARTHARTHARTLARKHARVLRCAPRVLGAQLAAYLVARAKEAVTFNFKGALLERGGEVRVKEKDGGREGAPPSYVAVATLGSLVCEAEASSMRDSEREAARRVLSQSGVSHLVGVPKKERTMLQRTVPPSASPATRRPNQRGGPPRGPPRGSGQGWAPVRLKEENAAANLANGETVAQWWLRSAQKPKKAFHRAAMAPRCFGRVVEHVGAFQRTHPKAGPDSRCSALVVLSLRDPVGTPLVVSFASTAATQNQALTRAALEANAAISKLIRAHG